MEFRRIYKGYKPHENDKWYYWVAYYFLTLVSIIKIRPRGRK